MSDQLPPVRVNDHLRERINTYGHKRNIESESEAIRELIRRGLREEDVARTALLLTLMKPEEAVEHVVDGGTIISAAWRDLLDRRTVDLIELAGGEAEVTKQQMAVAYRFERGDLDREDVPILIELLRAAGNRAGGPTLVEEFGL